jgi:phosphotriesterase-related protein
MAKHEVIRGKAQTVLGLINGSELGITLPHEHIFSDFSSFLLEKPIDFEEERLAHEQITLENLWFSRHHRLSSEDNMKFDDEVLAICEVTYFRDAGGKTIVDLTPIGVGYNPEGLVNVPKATGINIIMGTSYYTARSYTPQMKMDSKTLEDLANEFIRNITIGVADTDIKAGLIGEIGCNWPLVEVERKVLRAAGIAQQETGVAINIHPGADEDAPLKHIKDLEEVGADPSHVIISHMTRTFPIPARYARAKLAEKGCYLSFDLFGRDGDHPASPYISHDMANDVTRINEIMELIKDGFLDHILISHDMAFKTMLRSYGGGGYSYILKIIVPMMRRKGMTEEQIHTILVENPKRAITIA